RPHRRGRLRLAGHRPLHLRAGAGFRLHDRDGPDHVRRRPRRGRQPGRRRPLRHPRPPDPVHMISQGQIAETARLAGVLEGAATRPAQSFWSESWERWGANRAGMLAAAVIVFMALVALAAPLLSALVTHHNFHEQDIQNNFAQPLFPGHVLGTDEIGRDTLTRLIWGAQVSLGVGFLTVAISVVVGTSVGLSAGYFGGLADDVLMRLVDVILSIPRLFLFILVGILFFRSASLVSLSLVIASVGWGATARLVRAEA